MFWRVLIFIGGCTFLFNGVGIATSADCNSVSIKSQGRVISYTCYTDGSGGTSAAGAAALTILGGLALIALSLWPFIAGVWRNSRDRRIFGTSGMTRIDRHASEQAYAKSVMDAYIERERQQPAGHHSTTSPSPSSSTAVAATGHDGKSWRADPTGRYDWRVWDGKSWGDHVRTGDREFNDPYN